MFIGEGTCNGNNDCNNYDCNKCVFLRRDDKKIETAKIYTVTPRVGMCGQYECSKCPFTDDCKF